MCIRDSGNIVERSRYGLHFMINEDVLIEENILRDNSVGIYLMYGDRYTVLIADLLRWTNEPPVEQTPLPGQPAAPSSTSCRHSF